MPWRQRPGASQWAGGVGKWCIKSTWEDHQKAAALWEENNGPLNLGNWHPSLFIHHTESLFSHDANYNAYHEAKRARAAATAAARAAAEEAEEQNASDLLDFAFTPVAMPAAMQAAQQQQLQHPPALVGSINKGKRRMRSAGRATARHLRLEEAAEAAKA